jgi:hypothetical protein
MSFPLQCLACGYVWDMALPPLPITLDAFIRLGNAQAECVHCGASDVVLLIDKTEVSGGGTTFTVSTDAHSAFELYQTMKVTDLESLLAAHEADMAEAASPESIAFGGGRIALIRAVLKAKVNSDGES